MRFIVQRKDGGDVFVNIIINNVMTTRSILYTNI